MPNSEKRLHNASDLDNLTSADFTIHPALVLVGKKSRHNTKRLDADNRPDPMAFLLLFLILAIPLASLLGYFNYVTERANLRAAQREERQAIYATYSNTNSDTATPTATPTIAPTEVSILALPTSQPIEEIATQQLQPSETTDSVDTIIMVVVGIIGILIIGLVVYMGVAMRTKNVYNNVVSDTTESEAKT